MNKKTKIILISLATFSLLAVGAVAMYNQLCIDPEAEALRGLQREGVLNEVKKEKLKSLVALEQEEARRCSLFFFSKEKIEQIIAEKKNGQEEHLREMEEWRAQGLLDPKRLPSSELGIRTIDSVLPSSEFRQTNAWQGYLDNTLFLVAAGGSYPEPLRGMVVVLDRGFSGARVIYYTPTATGPVKIVAESNGVITLESVGGEYEVYNESTDTRGRVRTPGGETYRFNVRIGTFR